MLNFVYFVMVGFEFVNKVKDDGYFYIVVSLMKDW